jgi:hypothetical protein
MDALQFPCLAAHVWLLMFVANYQFAIFKGTTDTGRTHVESSKLTKISSSMPGGDYTALELGSPFEKYKKRRNCRG